MAPLAFTSTFSLWVIILVFAMVVGVRRRRARRRMWEQEALRSEEILRRSPFVPPPGPGAPRTLNLACGSCGGRATGSDVSPKGEIKCPYCGTWFDAYR